MKAFSLSLIFILFWHVSKAQNIQADSICVLESKLSESSGLLYIKGKVFTHNDSGNEPAIYELDSAKGTVIHTTYLKGIQNKDWEDLCADDSFVYVGDFGNNQGNRTDLKIFKFSKFALTEREDSVDVETISFSFEDQSNFDPAPYQTNFDAEALICIGDSLYIFSKNWGDFKSKIYVLPNKTGNWIAKNTKTLNTQGMVTGAAWNSEEHIILLCGYSFTGEFLYKLSIGENNDIHSSVEERFNLLHKGSSQIEGIAFISNNSYLISSEAFQSEEPLLHYISDLQLLELIAPEHDLLLYPNPVKDYLNIDIKSFKSVVLYDQIGKSIGNWESPIIPVYDLPKGSYFIIVHSTTGEKYFSKFQK